MRQCSVIVLAYFGDKEGKVADNESIRANNNG